MTEPVRHPRPRGLRVFISLALLVGLVALVLSVENAVGVNRLADQRNADRIASDLAGCRRGNIFRQQVIDQGHAVDELITGVLDAAFTPSPSTPPDRVAAIRAFRERLEAPLVAYRKTTNAIRTVDCRAVTPGAKEQP